MAVHHYVPVHVLANFACADAWKLVDTPGADIGQITKDDLAILSQQDRKRGWPVCVYKKQTKRLTRRIAKGVCSQDGLYRIPDHDTNFGRAITRLGLRLFRNPNDEEMIAQEDFLKMGETSLSANEIEELDMGQLDSDFAELARVLKRKENLDNDQQSAVLRHIAFSHSRTPWWKENDYPVLYGRAPLWPRLERLFEETKGSSLSPESESADMANAIYDMSYCLTLAKTSRSDIHPLTAPPSFVPKVRVLHATSGTRFCMCDNPGRPFRIDRLWDIAHSKPIFQEKGDRVVYPIDPKICISVSLNPDLPAFSHVEAKPAEIRKVNAAICMMAVNEIICPGPELPDVGSNYDITRFPAPLHP